MKVLWITNITFPEAIMLMGGKSEQKGGGGWMLASAEGLVVHSEIELSILSVNSLATKLECIRGEKISYYIIPKCKCNNRYESYMKDVNKIIQPDIVHIHGTELPFGWAWLNVCPADNVVVSIQGVVSVIARYYLAGLSHIEIIKNITIRDILRKTIYGEQREFKERGSREIEVLRKVNHIIGRTEFDWAHSKSINPDANYYYCGESLRSEFYEGNWSYQHCTPSTIFLSQGAYPLKGVHMVLKALPAIKAKYPDVKVRIAGDDIVHRNGLISRLRQPGYSRILSQLIKQNTLEECIFFTGRLDANDMKKEYLKANVFVCPSAIENSPNSIGEAQLLGVPIIASYVGGIPDMMKGDEEHLYRFEEVEMLANKIISVFDNKDGIDTHKMSVIARKRHDVEANTRLLVSIYNTMMNEVKN